MFWFSIFSLGLFVFLIGRTIQRILKRGTGKISKEYFLLVVFLIHIVVILYLLD